MTAAQVRILMTLEGDAAVRAGMAQTATAATALQRRINATTGVGGSGGLGGLLSAEGAASQMQARLDADLLRDRGLQLEKIRGGFRVAADEGSRFGAQLGEISNRTAMLGGRLLGIDPMLVHLGGRFGVFGLAAAAGVSILNKSIEEVRSNLAALELKDPGKLGALFNILTNSPFQRDRNATRTRLGTESDARYEALKRGESRTWEDDFNDWRRDHETNVGKLTPDELRAKRNQFRTADLEARGEDDFSKELRKKEEMNAALFGSQRAYDDKLADVREKNAWAAMTAEQQLAEARRQLKNAFGPLDIEQKRGEVARLEREAQARQEQEFKTGREELLAPWRSRLQQGFQFNEAVTAGSSADVLAQFSAKNGLAAPGAIGEELQREAVDVAKRQEEILSRIEAGLRGNQPTTVSLTE